MERKITGYIAYWQYSSKSRKLAFFLTFKLTFTHYEFVTNSQ